MGRPETLYSLSPPQSATIGATPAPGPRTWARSHRSALGYAKVPNRLIAMTNWSGCTRLAVGLLLLHSAFGARKSIMGEPEVSWHRVIFISMCLQQALACTEGLNTETIVAM